MAPKSSARTTFEAEMSRLLCAAAAAALLASGPALADSAPTGGGHGAHTGHSGGGWGHAGPGGRFGRTPVVFHGRSFGRLTPYEAGVWRQGHWYHGLEGGRFGWWWWADGGWFWYDAPIYPYPTDISDTVVDDAPPGAAPGTGFSWWYCDNPAGYWPYVRSCATPWQAVSPSPPPP
jgi:hypothetical protein